MTLCDDGHDEVCFETRDCPVCEMKKQISSLEEKMDTLEDEIKDIQRKDAA